MTWVTSRGLGEIPQEPCRSRASGGRTPMRSPAVPGLQDRKSLSHFRRSEAQGLHLEWTMRIRALVYALVALTAGVPGVAAAQTSIATTTIQKPAGTIPPGSTLSVRCQAEGDTVVGGMLGGSTTRIDSIDVTASGGSLSPTQLTGAGPRPCSAHPSDTCSWLEGTVSWVTPATAGTYAATCTVNWTKTLTFTGGQTPGTTVTSDSVTTQAISYYPPVVGAITGPSEVAAGASGVYEVTANDPNGFDLTYTWTATGGTIVQDSTNPARATWTAPATPGAQTITVAVKNPIFPAVQAQKSVTVVLATYQAGLPLMLVSPRRITS